MCEEFSETPQANGIDSHLHERRAELARKIQKGIDSLDRGEGIPGEIFEAKIDAKIRALRTFM